MNKPIESSTPAVIEAERLPASPAAKAQDARVNPEPQTVPASWPYDLNPPPEFSTDPATLKTEKQIADFVASFDQWHPDLWAKYAEKYGKDGVLNIPMEGTPVRTIVLSSSHPGQSIIVQRMNAMDFATLSREDQLRVAGTSAFDAVKASFGFERREEARYDGLAFDTYVDKVIADMRSQRGSMPETDMSIYVDEVSRLREQVNGQAIVKPSAIRKRINDIKEAFERAAQFANVRPQTYGPDGADAHYSDVISLDDGTAVLKGYNVLVQAEREICSTEARLRELVQRARTLDPAILIMEIMRLNQTITDAKSLRESEELKQQNELLNTYAAMQNTVSQTLRQFGADKDDETRRVTLSGKASYADLSDREKKIVSMFSTLFGKDAQRHPLEAMRSIERPLMDMVQDAHGHPLVSYTNAQWNTFGSQLAEVVTMLGQNTQLKMNDINTMRELSISQFEAASKAITRLSELITTISRNT